MPTLNWIGKDKVVNHHLDVPFYTLEHQYGFRGDNLDDKSETHSGNMIIHGDNLIALKAIIVEHILVYSKEPNWIPIKLERTEDMDAGYANPDNDFAPWASVILLGSWWN